MSVLMACPDAWAPKSPDRVFVRDTAPTLPQCRQVVELTKLDTEFEITE